jgi:hypothetical protein
MAVVSLLLVGGLPSCNTDQSTDPAPAASAPGPDRVALGELPPGREVAFGLKLPRQFQIKVREAFRIQAEGQVQPERVSNYVRLHVQAGAVDVGAAKTIFDQAVVKGTTEPKLRIEVIKVDRGTRLVVHNLTPQKIDPSLKKEDIQKLHGYDKDGKEVDPARFE